MELHRRSASILAGLVGIDLLVAPFVSAGQPTLLSVAAGLLLLAVPVAAVANYRKAPPAIPLRDVARPLSVLSAGASY